MGRSHGERLLWIIIALLLSSPLKMSAIRRDIGLPGKLTCRTTVQGRYLLSDDNGYVCTALSVDSLSRCCPEKGERFSCQGCNLVSQCCNSYEYCVSCCLNPTKTPKDLALNVKIAKPVTSGNYVSVFDFCAGRCRHNSASVVHENAYASDFHHCFSLQSNTSGFVESNSEAKLTGIDVIIGRQGESCNTACKSRGQSCVPNRLFVLNNCEYLQKYMRCKGSCFASMGTDQPAEVIDDAPKNVQNMFTMKSIYIRGNDHMLNAEFSLISEFPESRGMLVYPDRGHAFVRWFTSAYEKTLPMRMREYYFITGEILIRGCYTRFCAELQPMTSMRL